jgi:hypothetical protein
MRNLRKLAFLAVPLIMLPVSLSSPADGITYLAATMEPATEVKNDGYKLEAAPLQITSAGENNASQTGGDNRPTGPNNMNTNMLIKNKPYEQISVNAHTLINNVWGAPKEEKIESGIYRNSDGTFGWYWNRPNPVVNSGVASVFPLYPGIRIGGNRWERPKSNIFPLRLGNIKSLILDIDYQYVTAPTGTFDLSYDIFLSEPDQPDSNPQIKAEVMIWLEGNQKQPDRYYKGEFSDGNNTFSLYSWTMPDGRLYYSFILKSNSSSRRVYTVDANKLLRQLNLETDLLLHGIEFGNEVWSGSGNIGIHRYSIQINGQNI